MLNYEPCPPDLNSEVPSSAPASSPSATTRVQSEQPKELVQVVGQQRLATKVTSILNRIEEDLDSVDSKIGESMHVLDVDNDGLVRLLRVATDTWSQQHVAIDSKSNQCILDVGT